MKEKEKSKKKTILKIAISVGVFINWKDLLKRTLKGKKRQMSYAEEQIAGENTVKPNLILTQPGP